MTSVITCCVADAVTVTYFGATGVTSAAAGAITANLAYYSAVLAAGFQRKLREELEVGSKVKYDARDLRTIINPLSLRIFYHHPLLIPKHFSKQSIANSCTPHRHTPT